MCGSLCSINYHRFSTLARPNWLISDRMGFLSYFFWSPSQITIILRFLPLTVNLPLTLCRIANLTLFFGSRFTTLSASMGIFRHWLYHALPRLVQDRASVPVDLNSFLTQALTGRGYLHDYLFCYNLFPLPSSYVVRTSKIPSMSIRLPTLHCPQIYIQNNSRNSNPLSSFSWSLLGRWSGAYGRKSNLCSFYVGVTVISNAI